MGFMTHSIARGIAAVGLATLGVAGLAGCSSDSATDAATASASAPASPTASGAASAQTGAGAASEAEVTAAEEATDRFFSMLQRQDEQELEAFLSPAFQVARADGSTANKEQYLAAIPEVGAYEIDDFTVTTAGNAIIARYTVTTSERIDQQLYTEDPRQRLSVFVKDGDQLKLIAHANLNTPNQDAETIAPTPSDQPAGPSSNPADVTIATDTQNAFFTALKDGDTAALEQVLSPAFQLVRADGSAVTYQEYLANPATMNSFQLDDFVTTSDGDIIVAHFSGTTDEVIDGQQYATAPAPRFAVMQKDGDTWKIIAQANFNSSGAGSASPSPSAS